MSLFWVFISILTLILCEDKSVQGFTTGVAVREDFYLWRYHCWSWSSTEWWFPSPPADLQSALCLCYYSEFPQHQTQDLWDYKQKMIILGRTKHALYWLFSIVIEFFTISPTYIGYTERFHVVSFLHGLAKVSHISWHFVLCYRFMAGVIEGTEEGLKKRQNTSTGHGFPIKMTW